MNSINKIDRSTPPEYQPIGYPNVIWPSAIDSEIVPACFVLNDHTQSITQLELIIDSGVWHELQPGAAYFTATMRQEGTLAYDYKEITETLDRWGAQLSTRVTYDACHITLSALTEHFQRLLCLLHSLIFEPIFPLHRLAHVKNIKIQELRLKKEKYNYVAHNALRAAIFGSNHPYGQSLDESAVSQLRLSHLKQQQSRSLKNPVVLLSGNVSDDLLHQTVESLSELSQGNNNKENISLKTPITSQKIQHIDLTVRFQSSIALGRVIPIRSHPDYLDISIVTVLLGGYFGSRLMQNIREEKGYTYGISSKVIPLRYASYLYIATDVIQEHTKSALQEIDKEINRLQNEQVLPGELHLLKQYLLGSLLHHINTPFEVMDKFSSVYIHDLGVDYYRAWYNAVQSIDAVRIMEIAQQYLVGLDTVVVG